MIVARYFLVGAAAASVDFLVFAALTHGFDAHWFASSMLSFLLATALNYRLSVAFVFQQGARFSRSQEIGLVFLASAIGLAFNQLVLWISFEHLGIHLLISKIVATGAVFFWNFGSRRFYIFRKTPAASPD